LNPARVAAPGLRSRPERVQPRDLFAGSQGTPQRGFGNRPLEIEIAAQILACFRPAIEFSA
jgi:hypothetical protein